MIANNSMVELNDVELMSLNGGSINDVDWVEYGVGIAVTVAAISVNPVFGAVAGIAVATAIVIDTVYDNN
ncbi:hypothetical protein [Petroclostridium xylanilyticum]|jgi:hypothetical protein|uniref:hypothetical protein n=1 Tax=Petroclostridium xylanilyticum TaxID=1792311 RepID=UPI000B99C346|nr:hypothetical protein [Petroclostridium xylanilyticum]